MRQYAGLILAGGSNRRFPYPKGLIKGPDGRTLIQKNAAILRKFFSVVALSTNTPEAYFNQGLPMVGDIYPGRGPLGGIFSGLLSLETEGILVVACDMPSVKNDLIELILSCTDRGQVVVCQFGGRLQPMPGFYSQDIISQAEPLLKAGPVSMVEFIRKSDSVIIPEERIKKVDPEGQSFLNINTPEDLDRYLFYIKE